MIHELMTCDNWLNPQIDYLVWIQNIRLQLGPVFDNLFLNITAFGELPAATLLISIIYWCIDAEAGFYLFSLNSLGLLCLQIFKNCACIYRPWILSEKIHPIPSALEMARGYSFPSGHCMIAATSWGGLAFLLRKRKIISTLIVLLIILIAFSRTYLGVHTPQDVLTGLITGLILIFSIHYLLKWCEKDKNRYLYLLGLVNISIILTLIYLICKKYPLDYINGKLLVNPYHAKYIAILFCGWLMGLINGLLICKRFFPFETKNITFKTRIIRAIFGLFIFYGIFYPTNNYLVSHTCQYRIGIPVMFLVGFLITGIYPFIFTKIEKMITNK